MKIKQLYIENNITKVREIDIPDITLEDVKNKQKQLITNTRFVAETSGVDFYGSIIKTDRESQATLTSAWVTVQMKPNTLIDWKSATGWVKINKETVEAIANAVSTHVQDCFSKERRLCELIDNAKTIDEVKSIKW